MKCYTVKGYRRKGGRVKAHRRCIRSTRKTTRKRRTTRRRR